ncbi:receptor-type tyrosine-protein phosphatase beta-like [Ranitomeya imitator]
MAEMITTTSISLSWEKPNGNIRFYEIQILENPTFNKIVTSTSDTIDGLTPGNYYTLLVTAVFGENNVTGNSSEISVYTKPDLVKNLMTGSITTTSISVIWEKPDGNTSSYEIQILGDPSFNKTVTSTSDTIEGLTPGNYYTLLVSAVVGDNNVTGNSSEISVYTKPEVVENLMSGVITTTSISLSWAKPDGNASSYEIQILGDPTFNKTVATTSATIEGLTPGNYYTLLVSAVVGENNVTGNSSAISAYSRPATVIDLQSSTINSSTIYVSWLLPEGNRSSYLVEVIGDPPQSFIVYSESATINFLTSGSQYTVRISAEVGNGLLGDGKEISVLVADNITATLITTTSVQLNWNPDAGENTTYSISVYGEPSSTWTVNTTAIQITNLTSGNFYKIWVSAYMNNLLLYGYGGEISLYTRPGVVRNIQADNITTNSMTISWFPPESNYSHYLIEVTGDIYLNETTTSGSLPVSGLTPGNQYTVTIRAVTGEDVSGDPAKFIVTTKPEVVKNFMTGVITTTSISLSWEKPDGNASSYEIQILGEPTFNKSVTSTSDTIEGLTPGNYYTLLVTAVVGENYVTGNSSEISVYTTCSSQEREGTSSCSSVQTAIITVTPPPTSQSWLSSQSQSSLQPSVPQLWARKRKFLASHPQAQALNASISKLLALEMLSFRLVDTDTFRHLMALAVPQYCVPCCHYFSRKAVPALQQHVEKKIMRVLLNAISSKVHLTTDTWTCKHGQGCYISLTAHWVNVVEPGTKVDSGTAQVLPTPRIAGLSSVRIASSSYSLSSDPSAQQLAPSTSTRIGEPSTDTTKLNTAMAKRQQVVLKLISLGDTSHTAEQLWNAIKQQSDQWFGPLNLQPEPEVVKKRTGIITTTSISLSWEKPDGNASSYEIQILGDPTFNKTVTSTSATIEGLTPGNYYTLLVTAVVGDNNVTGSSLEISVYTKPEVVKNLMTGMITTTSISLSWEKPEGNTSSYIIVIPGDPTFEKYVTSTSTTIEGLTPGNYYTFLIYAVAGENVTGDSTEHSVYTKPEVVKNLMTGIITTTSISLSWEKPDGNASSYEIQIMGDPTFNKTVTSTSDTIEGLTPGNYYTLLVSAVIGDNNVTGNSSEISVYAKPDLVKNLMTGIITTTSISLSWAKPDGNASSYEIQILGDPTFNKTVTSTSDTIEGLTPGNYYIFLLSAVVGENNVTGNSSAISVYTKPEVVQNLITGIITTTSISLSWEKPDGNASSYEIQILGEPTFEKSVTSTSETIEGLTPGNYYTFLITAFVGENVTGNSSEITVYTQPEAVKNLMIDIITTTSIFLTWEKPDGNASLYEIQILGDPTFNKTMTTTYDTIEGLIPGNYYILLVTAAVGENNVKGTSSEIYVYTKPEVVKNLMTGIITTTSISLSWERPDGNASSYEIQILGEPTFNKIVTSTSVTIEGLTSGNYYTLLITVLVGENNVTGNSSELSVYTKPDLVKNLMTGIITTTSISLSWDKPDGNASSYEIQILEEPTFNKTVTSTSETIGSLTPGNYYTLLVSAVVGENDVTGASSEIFEYTKPEVVKNLMTGIITTTSIALSWAKPDGNASSYEIQILGEPTFNKTVTSTSDTIEGLTPGNYYTLLVTAVVGENNVTGNSTEISVYTSGYFYETRHF